MNTSTKTAHRRRHTPHNRSNTTKTNPKLILGALAVVFVVLVGYTIFRVRPGEEYTNLGNEHIAPPATWDYNTTPPTSGPHYGYIADWGIHADPIANEVQVHNLEDGGVMVQYDCDVADTDCAALVAQLSEIVEQYPTQVILAPYPDMDTRIALTAWTVLDAFDDFDAQRVTKFIGEYRGTDHHE